MRLRVMLSLYVAVCVSTRGFVLTFVPRPCIFLFAFGSTQSHTQLHAHRHTHTHLQTLTGILTHTHTLSRGDTHAFCFIYLPFCLISNLAHNFVFCCILCRVRLTRTHTRMHTARYLCVHSSLSLSVCVCIGLANVIWPAWLTATLTHLAAGKSTRRIRLARQLNLHSPRFSAFPLSPSLSLPLPGSLLSPCYLPSAFPASLLLGIKANKQRAERKTTLQRSPLSSYSARKQSADSHSLS